MGLFAKKWPITPSVLSCLFWDCSWLCTAFIAWSFTEVALQFPSACNKPETSIPTKKVDALIITHLPKYQRYFDIDVTLCVCGVFLAKQALEKHSPELDPVYLFSVFLQFYNWKYLMDYPLQINRMYRDPLPSVSPSPPVTYAEIDISNLFGTSSYENSGKQHMSHFL